MTRGGTPSDLRFRLNQVQHDAEGHGATFACVSAADAITSFCVPASWWIRPCLNGVGSFVQIAGLGLRGTWMRPVGSPPRAAAASPVTSYTDRSCQAFRRLLPFVPRSCRNSQPGVPAALAEQPKLHGAPAVIPRRRASVASSFSGEGKAFQLAAGAQAFTPTRSFSVKAGSKSADCAGPGDCPAPATRGRRRPRCGESARRRCPRA